MDKQRKDSVQFVHEKCDEGTNWAVIRQMQINRAFYASQQWISWDRVNRNVYVPELRPGEKRLTFNKIKPSILTLLSKMCKNRVQLEVNPDTNDIDRIEVAKGGHKVLKYQWGEDTMDQKTRRLKFHMLVDGFPALKVCVDKTQGQDIPVLQNTDLGEDMDSKSMPTKTGKIITQVVDQYALKVDPSAESVEEIRWALEERPWDVNEIEEIWGKEVAPDDNIVMRTFDVTQTDTRKKYKNMAMVRDYWELPCSKYPKGRRIVVAGNIELENTEDPGEFPFIFFPAIPIPGTAIATGVVTDLTTPQKSYNIKRTAEARILEEMGNPIWLTPSGSLPMDGEELVNEIGANVEYTGEKKPERVQGATVDAGWQNAMERDVADMEDISGAHEISKGGAQKGNDTLGGLQLQVEQDETKLALLVQSYEDGIKQWGEKVLRLIQKHFPEEQQLSIVGENGEIEAFAFSGADLTGNEVVDVVPGSSMPTLKAVQDQKILTMWGAGMFNDPRTGAPDVRKVVRMLGESIATQYFDDTEQDENKALMENRMYQQTFGDPKQAQAVMQYMQTMQEFQAQAVQMAQNNVDINQLGIKPPPPPVKLPIVRDFYDHETHIMAHNRYRKSDDYDQLPPELQQIIDQHVAEHEQYLMAPQMEAQQQQMQMMQQQEQSNREAQAAQSQEADKQHQRTLQLKQMDNDAKMQSEALKANTALQTAQMRGQRA